MHCLSNPRVGKCHEKRVERQLTVVLELIPTELTRPKIDFVNEYKGRANDSEYCQESRPRQRKSPSERAFDHVRPKLCPLLRASHGLASRRVVAQRSAILVSFVMDHGKFSRIDSGLCANDRTTCQ